MTEMRSQEMSLLHDITNCIIHESDAYKSCTLQVLSLNAYLSVSCIVTQNDYVEQLSMCAKMYMRSKISTVNYTPSYM